MGSFVVNVIPKEEAKRMIRRTRRGDVITNRHMYSTKPWFHFPVGTRMERITVATAPVISVDQQQRLRLLRPEQRPRPAPTAPADSRGKAEPDLHDMDRVHNRIARGLVLDELLRLLRTQREE
jgi:hypothetical protein